MIETIQFPVAGMSCASCVNRITRSLKRVDGVLKVKVDLGPEMVTVRRESLAAPIAAIAAAIVSAGFEPDLASAVVLPNPPETSGLLGRLARALTGGGAG